MPPRARVALVTCAELRDLDPDDRLLIAPLAAAGVAVDAAVWDDPTVDWSQYDLAVIRSSWDYPARRDEFVAWAPTVPRLANPADVVAWNTDKRRYLTDLAAAGVPTIPTVWISPTTAWEPPMSGEWVIKPAVGAGSVDTGRYDAGDRAHRELAAAHVARLQAAGRHVMAQPFLDAVDTYGETALLFFRGEFSHAIRKGPMLQGPDAGVAGLYRPEKITPREPSPAERAVAAAALAAVPGGADRLLYARVDLIPAAMPGAGHGGHVCAAGPPGGGGPGVVGDPLLVEVELTEPSLFLGTARHAPAKLAAAITASVLAGAPDTA